MVLWKPLHWRRFLVASRLVRDLLLCAKYLFVAAMVCLGCGVTWLNEGGANWPQAMSTRWDKRFRAVMERALLGEVAFQGSAFTTVVVFAEPWRYRAPSSSRSRASLSCLAKRFDPPTSGCTSFIKRLAGATRATKQEIRAAPAAFARSRAACCPASRSCSPACHRLRTSLRSMPMQDTEHEHHCHLVTRKCGCIVQRADCDVAC
jgi:hypothetical protein